MLAFGRGRRPDLEYRVLWIATTTEELYKPGNNQGEISTSSSCVVNLIRGVKPDYVHVNVDKMLDTLYPLLIVLEGRSCKYLIA
jgi:hypothetical protein